ncbi:hypothetical protein CDD81_2360 [Ophiocordyceps australis]|uniref:Uncharacterized protein n=1 Tax=Ophiocordyceps australis TaxID=1399860 RepID=A0A2C5X7M8_9HYPO|nr:hypothetical protein CDD81_2360 [Ophiocordyceps australis]
MRTASALFPLFLPPDAKRARGGQRDSKSERSNRQGPTRSKTEEGGQQARRRNSKGARRSKEKQGEARRNKHKKREARAPRAQRIDARPPPPRLSRAAARLQCLKAISNWPEAKTRPPVSHLSPVCTDTGDWRAALGCVDACICLLSAPNDEALAPSCLPLTSRAPSSYNACAVLSAPASCLSRPDDGKQSLAIVQQGSPLRAATSPTTTISGLTDSPRVLRAPTAPLHSSLGALSIVCLQGEEAKN